MKCPNCGATAISDFCEYCGTNLNNINNARNGGDNKFQPFNGGYNYNYNYNYKYTNDGRQPFAANTGKYAPPQNNNRPYSANEKSVFKLPACFVLCLIFGLFGAHRFYVGRKRTGRLYACTLGLLGIGWITDLIVVACGGFKDNRKRRLKWRNS